MSRWPFRRPIHNWPHVCNEQLAARRRSECTCGTMNSDPSDRHNHDYTQWRRWGRKIPKGAVCVLGPLSAWKTESQATRASRAPRISCPQTLTPSGQSSSNHGQAHDLRPRFSTTLSKRFEKGEKQVECW